MTIRTSQPMFTETYTSSAKWPAEVRMPDFFIVGAPRCGTTALYTYLRQHPEIFMPKIKEPNFFAEFLGEHRRIRTWPDYAACFADGSNEKRVGEASVAYLASHESARVLRGFNPDASIIIMLRNPIEVMHSLYHLRRFSNIEDQTSFEAALRADANGRRVVELTYRERVRFAEQVERYLLSFGAEKVHIIIYDDFKKDTLRVYQSVLRFLGVCIDSRRDFPIVNNSRRARNRALWTALRRPPMFLRRMIHPMTSREIRKSLGSFLVDLNTVYEARPPIGSDVRRMLQEDLAGEVWRLSAILGRDLSSWCEPVESHSG